MQNNLQSNLLLSIVIAVIGVVAAFFACNALVGPVEKVTFKTVDSTVNTTLAEPSPELFNYLSINPTVEVYVGECKNRDESGICLDTDEDSSSTETDNQETE